MNAVRRDHRPSETARDYTPEFETKVMRWAQKRQGKKRFAHTERVVETVTRLAERWLPDQIMVCRLAGWIHDAAKRMSDEALLDYAITHRLEISPTERDVPMLLHGMVAYWQANEKFALNDEQIRTACTYHTTGSPDMNLLDKLLFIADLIEPERDFPLVDALREMALVDVDQTMLLAIDGTLRYLLSQRKLIDPRVILLYNVLLKETGAMANGENGRKKRIEEKENGSKAVSVQQSANDCLADS